MPPPNDLARRDLAVVWHPCTQMKDHEWLPMIPILRGEGVWLYDADGRRYLDAISSWWVNLFGHANPRIGAAVTEQLGRLEHVMLAGFTHGPAVELAERLTALAPPGLTRCFYADNGSSAIEVALKMSFHYWRNAGRPGKRRFVTLTNSYHGETLGALAVGHVELYREIYQPLLMDVITVPSPDCYAREPGEDWEAHSRRMFAQMEATLARHADEVCAVIVEPLVQCAGSMRMYHPGYLAAAARGLRPARRAPDRRRDRGRLRPHRHAVRLRAGRHRAGLPLPVEGPDRRLPAALGRADRRAGLRGLLRRVREPARVPALAQLHRQPARVPRSARDARHLRERRRDRAQPHARGASRRARAELADLRHVAEVRQHGHDRRGGTGARRRPAAGPFRGRSGADCASTSTACATRRCCGRSATSSTSCRRT